MYKVACFADVRKIRCKTMESWTFKIAVCRGEMHKDGQAADQGNVVSDSVMDFYRYSWKEFEKIRRIEIGGFKG